MIDHEEYINYHRGLAEKHRLIEHVTGKRIGWVGTDHTELTQLFSSNKLSDVIMAMDEIQGRIMIEESTSMRDVVMGGFFIWVKKSDTNLNFRSTEQALAKAKQIGFSVLARIMHESTDYDTCPRTFRPMPDTATYRMAQFQTHYVGWGFQYSLEPVEETSFESSDWSDL